MGWICRQCNNFNFETRNKCNRCQSIKMPKTKEEIKKKKEKNKKNKKKIKERKTDWLCLNCKNLNYGFRKNCNRCKIERKEEFPTVYLEPKSKTNEKDNNLFLMNNINTIQMNMKKNSLNKNIENNNNNYNNNSNINNNINYNYNKIQSTNIFGENNLNENQNYFNNNYINYK